MENQALVSLTEFHNHLTKLGRLCKATFITTPLCAAPVVFLDLFTNQVDYPDAEQLLCGVPQDTLYRYVPSTYLNELIDYAAPGVAILLNGTAEDVAKLESQPYHSNYSNHDVVVLGQTADSVYYFRSDQDVSDCSIGRIDKAANNVTLEDVLELVIPHLNTRFESCVVLQNKPRGWVSF